MVAPSIVAVVVEVPLFLLISPFVRGGGGGLKAPCVNSGLTVDFSPEDEVVLLRLLKYSLRLSFLVMGLGWTMGTGLEGGIGGAVGGCDGVCMRGGGGGIAGVGASTFDELEEGSEELEGFGSGSDVWKPFAGGGCSLCTGGSCDGHEGGGGRGGLTSSSVMDDS